MVALNSSRLTLADWAKRVDPNGTIPMVAELLSQTNEILTDCVFVEGNLPTGHRVTVRTGLPTVQYRALNEGIAPTKSTTAQIDEAIGILEARSEVDKDLAMLNGNTAAFRLSEDRAFLEAMNQEMATTMFYGDPATDSKKFLGLAPRYSSTAASVASSQNVISALGSTNLTSVWLVCWGDQTVFCPFPKGSAAGLQHRDLGEQTVYMTDEDAVVPSTRMQAFVSHYQWKSGLVIKDWRYAVRICDIDTVALLAQSSSSVGDPSVGSPGANALVKLMARALDRIPNNGMGKMCFYMNRTVGSGLKIMAMDKSQNALGIQQATDQFGRSNAFLTFLGVPIRISDAITNSEAEVDT